MRHTIHRTRGKLLKSGTVPGEPSWPLEITGKNFVLFLPTCSPGEQFYRRWASRKARQGAVDAREGRAAWLDHTIDASGEVDDAAGLPDDPAAALAELRRRADAADSPHARDQGQPPA